MVMMTDRPTCSFSLCALTNAAHCLVADVQNFSDSNKAEVIDELFGLGSLTEQWESLNELLSCNGAQLDAVAADAAAAHV